MLSEVYILSIYIYIERGREREIDLVDIWKIMIIEEKKI